MCKKYQSYKISVTYENLSEELIEYNYINKSINNYNYNEMLKVYREFKECCSENVIQIDFMGVSSEGQLGIIFTKDCKVKPKHSVSESTDSLIEEAKEIIKVISDKRKYHSAMIDVLNKKENIELHRIEHIDLYEDDMEKEKLNIIDRIYKIRKNRRFHKEELAKINNIIANIKIIKSSLNVINIPISTCENIQYLTDERVEMFRIMKEISYKNDKDKINLMNQLKVKYSKINDDSVNNKLICYNKAN